MLAACPPLPPSALPCDVTELVTKKCSSCHGVPPQDVRGLPVQLRPALFGQIEVQHLTQQDVAEAVLGRGDLVQHALVERLREGRGQVCERQLR